MKRNKIKTDTRKEQKHKMENKEKKNNKNGKKAVLWVLLAIAVVLVAAVLMRSCGSSSSEEPEESAEPTEAVDDEAGKNATETSTKATAKPKTSAEPDETEEPDASAEPSATASPTSTTKPTSATETAEPTATPHVHSYTTPVYKTVHHDEVGHYETEEVTEVVPAYDEDVPIEKGMCYCNACQSYIDPSEIATHIIGVHNNQASYQAVSVITGYETVHHEATTVTTTRQKWVVDVEAWDEQVIDYYECPEDGAVKR